MLGIGKFAQMQQQQQQPGMAPQQQPRGPAAPTVPPANRYCFPLLLENLIY